MLYIVREDVRCISPRIFYFFQQGHVNLTDCHYLRHWGHFLFMTFRLLLKVTLMFGTHFKDNSGENCYLFKQSFCSE